MNRDYRIIEFAEDDWRKYRSIRLASLKESPDAFASTFEREAAFDESQWRSRLTLANGIHDAVAVCAVKDQRPVGLASSVVHTPDSVVAMLYQMWVTPVLRGQGIATGLLRYLHDWAFSRSIRTVRLSVTTINADALSLYMSAGYRYVGDEEPLRDGSTLQSQTMELQLVGHGT